jgi:hypothetical protein
MLSHSRAQVIPFVAGGFLYIGAVAVLPTSVKPPPLPKARILKLFPTAYWQKVRVASRHYVKYISFPTLPGIENIIDGYYYQFAAMAFGVLCMFLVA